MLYLIKEISISSSSYSCGEKLIRDAEELIY